MNLPTHIPPTHTTPAVEQAWQAYLGALDRFRSWLLNKPFAAHPTVRAQALYFVQQMQGQAFMRYVAPRTAYPMIQMHGFFTPVMYTNLFPNPDFVYRYVFLDGARRYRMWGRLGTARSFSDMQHFSSFWGDDETISAGKNYLIEDYADGDGRFEIFLGPNATGERSIALDPARHNNYFPFREAIVDWEREEGMEIHIESLDDVSEVPILADEEEMNRRLHCCARLLDYVPKFLQMNQDATLKNGEWNVFHHIRGADRSNDLGGNPSAHYMQMGYDFGEDEALVIETDLPECGYWGVQLSDIWLQTTDYSFHQSSLNQAQSHFGADGKFRCVIAHRDPGVPNWLDTVAPGIGIAILRWYKAKGVVPVPKVTRVPLARLRAHLPADTPTVTPQERSDALQRRQRASLRRYGF
jgi:hypothetical protein